MAIIGSDTFQRIKLASTNWGHATDGQSWATVHGGGTYADAGTEGTVTGTTAEVAEFLGSTTAANFDITVRMSRATSTTSATSVLCRATGSTTYYKVRLKSGSIDITKDVSASTTVLVSTNYTVIPGSYDWMHVNLVGSVLSVNVWADSDPNGEPSGWMLSATDAAIGGSGQYGLGCTLQPGDTASFDSFICSNLVSPSLITDNPYGFTVLNKSPILLTELQDIVNIGAAWIRPQTNWTLMEKTDDGSRGSTLSSVIDWTLMDDIIKKCNNLGLRCCLTIQNPPAWHCTVGVNAQTLIPNALDTIAFGTALAQRYNGGAHGVVQAIMFNEDFDAYSAGWPLGTGGSFNPTYTSRDFTPLGSILPTLYPAIKAANASILVGCASALGKRTDATHIGNLLTELWTSGVGSNVDFVDLHFYNCSADPTLPNNNLADPPLIDRINAIATANTSAGHGSMDIWMTEFGYQVNNGGPAAVCDVSAILQSYYLRKTMSIAKDHGVSHMFIWTIGGRDNNSLTQGNGPSKTYMPAYFDIQNYITQQSNTPSSVTLSGTKRRDGAVSPLSRRDGLTPQVARRG